MVRVPIGRGLTWACQTVESAAVMRDVFAGRYASSPRARAIRAVVGAQPALPGMAVLAAPTATRRVPSYADRTAKRRASVAAKVGAYQ